jgi:hypothetical protein
MMKGILALAILAAPSAACSDQTNNPDFVRYVATDVKKDCLKGLDKAPNQAMRQHLQRLCDCTEQRILATPMGGSDNDRSVNEKVQKAIQTCYAQLGGAPGEKGR